MTKVWALIGYLLALATVVFIPWAIVRGVEKDPSVVGSFATALAAVVAVVLARVYEKRLEVEEAHREKIAPRYQELFERVAQVGGPRRNRDGTTTVFFQKLSRDLLFYGSDSVVRTWLQWQRSFDSEIEVDMGGMLEWEKVLFAIRRDLGHKNDGLNEGDLLRLYVNDVDEHMAAWRAGQAIAAGPSTPSGA